MHPQPAKRVNQAAMVGVVFNPNAGRGRAGARRGELERLLDAGLPGGWMLAQTEKSGDGERQVQKLLDAGATRIAAAGGDGTLSECLSVLASTDVPMAVIPVGTGNDFGRQIGVRTMTDGVDTLVEDFVIPVDLAFANGKPYLDTLACGFDSAVGVRVNEGFRYLKGTAAYVGAIVSTLGSYQCAQVTVDLDGQRKWEGRAMLAAICNCRSYGGGFQVAPDASITDGLLDVVVVEEMSRLRFLSQLPKVMKGKHTREPGVHIWKASRVSLRTEPASRYMVDGEMQGLTPVDVEVKAGARPMVVPRLFAASQPLGDR